MVERVVDKARANFCELFEATTPTGLQGAAAPDEDGLRQAAEALFK